MKYLGKSSIVGYEGLDVLVLDDAPETVRLECDEMSARCPVTGQPDLYTVHIDYSPVNGQVIESKSLKIFFWSLRDEPISCEALAVRIASEIRATLGGIYEEDGSIEVEVVQKSRGGISITGVAYR